MPQSFGAQSPEFAGGDPTLPPMRDMLATMGYDAPGQPESPQQRAAGIGEYFDRECSVTDAPTLQQALANSAQRDGMISHWAVEGGSPLYGLAPESTSEAEALAELDRYLVATEAMFDRGDNETWDNFLYSQVLALRDQLFFIGKPEFEEGAAGIAALWRSYLENDPDLELIVPYLLGSVKPVSEYKKSQELVYAAVMRHFPTGDPLRIRIRGGGQGNPSPGRRGLVIILDDWSKSGLQATTLYQELRNPATLEIEMHLLAASEEQLTYGVGVHTIEHTQQDMLPVKAYFRAGNGAGTIDCRGPLVTGSHSSVDFDFKNVLMDIQRRGPVDEHGNPLVLPVLARVAPRPRSRLWSEAVS